MEQSHGEAISALEGERSQLETALGGAREQITGLEGDVAAAKAIITERDAEIDKHKDTILARDSRISALKQKQLEIEAENTGYQEQVLKAFQKIKADTEVVERAKKAMAIAITLLDENISALRTRPCRARPCGPCRTARPARGRTSCPRCGAE
jgi:chromosome segregation ATPase